MKTKKSSQKDKKLRDWLKKGIVKDLKKTF